MPSAWRGRRSGLPSCCAEGRAQLAHATTTLGVSLGWGDDPGVRGFAPRRGRALAEEAGDHDELFRVYANLTTVLDLVGRREEAVKVAYEGIEATRRAGLEAVYGNFLRATRPTRCSSSAAGRVARDQCHRTGVEPGRVAFVNSVDSLAIVEIETMPASMPAACWASCCSELETVARFPARRPIYRAAASFALWRGDLVDARRAAERGWQLVADGGMEPRRKIAATVAEVDGRRRCGCSDPPRPCSPGERSGHERR